MTSDSMAPPQVAFSRAGQAELRVELSGGWTLAGGIPLATDLTEQLGGTPPPARVTFDTQNMSDWDSGLLTYLSALVDLCSQKGITMDKAGLPHGVGGLLDLAFSVPERAGARRSVQKRSVLYDIGTDVIAAARTTGEFIAFLGDSILTFGTFVRGKAVYRKSDLWRVMQDTGARALPIVSLVTFLVGLILAFVGAVQLKQFGAGIFVADLVGIAMVRELGGIMAAIIMAGRTGAAFAAELGSMTLNEEVDALETAGFSYMQFLVLPRMLALVAMMPLLTVYADLMGVLGGAIVAVPVLDLQFAEYFNEVYQAVVQPTFSSVSGKPWSTASSWRWWAACGASSAGVARRLLARPTTSAVVSSIVMIVVACAVMTVLFQANEGYEHGPGRARYHHQEPHHGLR